MKKEKCRCYINFKYYAYQAKIGGYGMKNYKPCPIHEPECYGKKNKNDDKGTRLVIVTIDDIVQGLSQINCFYENIPLLERNKGLIIQAPTNRR